MSRNDETASDYRGMMMGRIREAIVDASPSSADRWLATMQALLVAAASIRLQLAGLERSDTAVFDLANEANEGIERRLTDYRSGAGG